MRQVIDHYIASLAERGELDAVIRNLLVARGDEVIKQAFRGEKELGVDIASLRSEQDGQHLYLFQVKSGDLDKNQWDNGTSNSVRQSLNEAIDARFTSYAKLSAPPVRTHLIVIFNGEIKADVRNQFEGFVNSEQKRHPEIEITYWSQSAIVNLVEIYLLNEAVLPNIDPITIKKALAFADTPDYGFLEYRNILDSVLEGLENKSKTLSVRTLSSYRVISRMISHYAHLGKNYKNAVICQEIMLLKYAHWRQVEERSQRHFVEATSIFLEDYLEALKAFCDRYKPAILKEDGLFLGAPSEIYEFPLRCFEITGFLSLYYLTAIWLKRNDEAQEALNVLESLIRFQTGSTRPVLDSHGVDIALAGLSFIGSNNSDSLSNYLVMLLNSLSLRKRLHHPLPEYTNNMEAVIAYHATTQRPEWYDDSSSSLIWIIMELSLFGNGKEDLIYEAQDFLKQLKYTQWYPDDNYPSSIFSVELHEGPVEVDPKLPEDDEKMRHFMKARFKELEKSNLLSKRLQKDLEPVAFVAFRHFRTPVFPQCWRRSLQ